MSLFGSLKPKANLSRNAFDQSRRDVFSSKVSMLVPSFVQETIPDAVYDVRQLSLIRVDSMQTSSFARMSQNTEYFFVPFSQIFRDFETLYYERGENQRNVGNISTQGVASMLPRFNVSSLMDEFMTGYILLQIYDYVLPNLNEYQKVKIREDYESNWPNFFDVHHRLAIEDQLRIYDMLGYGNLLPVLRFYYTAVYTNEYIATGATGFKDDVDGIENWLASHEDNWDTGAFLGLVNSAILDFGQAVLKGTTGPEASWNDFITGYRDKYLSVIRIAAWKKIWSDFYRNAQYDVVQNYAYLFNYDYAVTNALGVVTSDKILRCLLPCYRQYKKDVFTGSYPTAQFGSVAVAATENPVSIVNTSTSYLTNSNVASLNTTTKELLVRTSSGASGATGSDKWSIDSSVSALSIRQAMAMQKYKETILRAGNRTRALQNAIFGDKSRYIADEYVDFLGAVSAPIDFNSVAATSEGNGQNVGQLSSYGVSTLNNNSFKYHSHDFGVIIGVFYILSESEYNSYMVDPQVRKLESFDFYKPHFQNMGLDPVFNIDNNFFPDLPRGGTTYDLNISVIGYLAKYFEYKTSIDKVHGEFYNALPFELSSNLRDYTYTIPMLNTFKGAFTGFVTPRSPYQFNNIDISSLYARPDDVDDIFYASSDEHQSSDQFKVNCNHNVGSVLPMSVVGLPQ